jgi:hypothetical protein
MLMGWKTPISVTLVVILRLIAVSLVAITGDGNRAELERVLPFGACVSSGRAARLRFVARMRRHACRANPIPAARSPLMTAVDTCARANVNAAATNHLLHSAICAQVFEPAERTRSFNCECVRRVPILHYAIRPLAPGRRLYRERCSNASRARQ